MNELDSYESDLEEDFLAFAFVIMIALAFCFGVGGFVYYVTR